MQLIKEYKSIVNGLIKTISDKFKTLQKLHLIKILRQIFFDHHPVTYKFDVKTSTMLLLKNKDTINAIESIFLIEYKKTIKTCTNRI